MRFELPETSGERAEWTHKSIFRGLLRCVPLPLSQVAKALGMSTQTMNSYSSPLNQTRPKSETISKMMELVSDHVDEVIAASRSLEAEFPLTEAEFVKRFAPEARTAALNGDGDTARIRIRGRLTTVNSVVFYGDGWRAIRDKAISEAQTVYNESYLRVLQDPKPVLIEGAPLSDDPRLRKKMLLLWGVKGLNITRAELGKSMGLHRVTIDSWLGHSYKVAPPATVVNDLVRLYSTWAVDARDEIDEGKFDITIPTLPPHWEFNYPEPEPDTSHDIITPGFRLGKKKDG